VLMNAALALATAAQSSDLKECVRIGVEAIDSGAAQAKLSQLRDLLSPE
jgi:anthranilate phosphoribosyltransferase